MERTQHSTRKINANGPGRDGFTGGVIGLEPPTVLDADVMNSHQEELAGAIEAHGCRLNPADFNQLTDVLQSRAELAAIANASVIAITGGPTLTGFATNGNGRIVLVGMAPTAIATSDDGGLSWTAQSPPDYTGPYHDVTYAAGLFVAVGDYVIHTSPDGETWTERYSGSPTFLHRVAYGNGRFVVSANQNTLVDNLCGTVTSTDGVSWTYHGLSISLSQFALAFGAGRFVSPHNTAPTTVYSSPDGVTWVTGAWGGGAQLLATGLDRSAKGFFAAHGTCLLGDDYPVTGGGNGGPRSLQISTDGLTWTEVHHGSGEASGLIVTDIGAYSLTHSRTETDWAFVSGTAAAAQDHKVPLKVFAPRMLRYHGRSCVTLGRSSGSLWRSAMFLGPA